MSRSNSKILCAKLRRLLPICANMTVIYISSALPATAASATVIGDSIGVGISMAGGAQRLAKNSVSIGSSAAIAQIGHVKSGQIIVVSLGTNNAVGSLRGVEAGIDRTINAIKKSGHSAVWVGPPCVNKRWNANVVKLDHILASKLSGANIAYASVAGESYCNPTLKQTDGVHYNMAGYSKLWERARSAGGF